MLVASPLAADEGMWMPSQIPDLVPRLRELGFQGEVSTFTDLTGYPMGAIVWLGGCTASFVSPDGLIATNHHCATGALQYNSTPERNLLRDGFLATTRAEELSNGPGSQVWVTVSFRRVTDAITGDIDPALDDLERYELIERRIKEQTAACEVDGLRCEVASFFEGLDYYELAQLEIPDVRLVYAPAAGIGNFGGETDNWRWPRHTGDWSFFRAYVGPDGRPAPFSGDNVPFKPKHVLKVQPRGVDDGDFVFVAGYPGKTQRLYTYDEVKTVVDWTYPSTVRRYQEQIAILEALGQQDEALKLKAASRLRGLHNSLTNRQGMLEGLVDGGILARKKKEQQELVAWIAADPAREAQYGHVLAGLAEVQNATLSTRERDDLLEQMLPPLGSRTRVTRNSMVAAAHTALLLAQARELEDVDRDRELQERNWSRIRDVQQRMQRSLDVQIDRALLRWALVRAAALPADQRLLEIDKLVGLTPGMSEADSARAIDAALDRLYAGTRMDDESFRLSLLEMTPAELEAVDDTFVDLAAALDPLYQQVREAESRAEGAASRLRPLYARALIEKASGPVAPDANSTLRVTYGTVRGVDASTDGIYWKPFTTLAGIEQKHTGEGEFNAPAAELEAIAALRNGKETPYLDDSLGDVPVDFLSTVDTTGGNSGSPTLNDRGELVGLLFDGTYDTIASDFLFDPIRTRSIHVDVRYLLWVMANVDGATHLLEEMGLR
jgi:hypothetical protein